ncbi:MAG: hypothetical protein VKJ09_14750 [Leptolyngbya sp.]|nr:hypothetical protein [Leptolyngbya sp.]
MFDLTVPSPRRWLRRVLHLPTETSPRLVPWLLRFSAPGPRERFARVHRVVLALAGAVLLTACQMAAQEPTYLVDPPQAEVDLSTPLPTAPTQATPAPAPEDGGLSQAAAEAEAAQAIAAEKAQAEAALSNQTEAVRAFKDSLEATAAAASRTLEATAAAAKETVEAASTETPPPLDLAEPE